MKQSEHRTIQKKRILAVFIAVVFALLLTACANSGGDKIERFAEAAPDNGENIDIPGYETLIFAADKISQTVHLKNPATNACAFVLTLTLDDGTILWTGETLSPGMAFTRITLACPLDAGEYAATLHYDCYSLQDNTPLNAADIKLKIDVR